jgi:hypothetical protein
MASLGQYFVEAIDGTISQSDANLSVEQMAAGGTVVPIRPSRFRRH